MECRITRVSPVFTLLGGANGQMVNKDGDIYCGKVMGNCYTKNGDIYCNK